MILKQVPNSKWPKLKQLLRVGEDYEILGEVGNGYIIQPPGCEDKLVLLKSSFESK